MAVMGSRCRCPEIASGSRHVITYKNTSLIDLQDIVLRLSSGKLCWNRQTAFRDPFTVGKRGT